MGVVSKYLNLVSLTNFIILYFKSRNIGEFGFCRYGIFKRLIKYALDTKDLTLVRRVFDLMRTRHVVEEADLLEHKVYLFNPYHRPYRRRMTGLVDWTD